MSDECPKCGSRVLSPKPKDRMFKCSSCNSWILVQFSIFRSPEAIYLLAILIYGYSLAISVLYSPLFLIVFLVVIAIVIINDLKYKNITNYHYKTLRNVLKVEKVKSAESALDVRSFFSIKHFLLTHIICILELLVVTIFFIMLADSINIDLNKFVEWPQFLYVSALMSVHLIFFENVLKGYERKLNEK